MQKKITIPIRSLGTHGEGVGDFQGYTIFVDGALPGEEVEVEMTANKKSYGIGKLLKILKPSPHRVDPVCPLASRCGGCQVMHLDYSVQLEQKRQRVIDAFKRIGKFKDLKVSDCVPSPSQLHYRNKVQAPIRKRGRGIRIGFYSRNSHELVDVDTCFIHCSLGDQVYAAATALLKQSGIDAYDWETGEGELRHLIIRTAAQKKQALVVIVTKGAAVHPLKQIADAICRKCPEVKGVIQNVNPHPHNVVLGNCYQVLAGEASMEEEILGFRFAVSAASFFQVNPWQAEKLYQQVIDWAELTGKEKVVDAYCGVGTLSLLLAKGAGQVVGVECIAQAIEDAKRNAALNRIGNAAFICAEAETWIQSAENVDLVILNPPRKGCHPSMIEALGKMRPPRLIYVSCDPATLARDSARLKEVGYQIDAVQPFDMFPQTAHVETVVKYALIP